MGGLDLHSGSPLWFLLHGLRAVAPPLETDDDCDAAVIGAGITGALTAHALRGAGLDVVVLDRRDLGQGSTMASTALLQYDLDVPLHRLTGMIGREDAQRAFIAGTAAIARLEAIGEEIGSLVERVPSVYALLDGPRLDEFAAEFDARVRAGLEVRWLTAEAARREFGLDVRAGIASTQAAQLDPYNFTHALLAHGRERGVRVYDRTGVVDVRDEGERLRLVTDRGASVRSRWVVHATGYEAAVHLPKDAVELQSTYAFASEPMSRPPSPFMVWEYGDPYVYARWAGDRLVFGGGDETFVDEARRDRLITAKARKLAERARALMPGVLPEVGFAWAGTFATTPDGLGYIGAIDGRGREFVALGFGGNGITMSALAAEIIRDRVQGRTHEYADLYRVDRNGGAAGASDAATAGSTDER